VDSSLIRHHSVRYTCQAWALVPCFKVGDSAKAGSWIYSLRGSTISNRFVHVWMPPLVQEISERFECVIGCGHVSGLSLQRLIQPRAGMAMREPKADQQIELIGSCTKTALSGPDLSDHFPLLFIDLLTHSSPGARYTAHCAHAIVAAGVR
jgi:hypothetical protein